MSDSVTGVFLGAGIVCGSLVVSLLTMAGTEAEMQLRGTVNEHLPEIAFTGMMSGMSCLCLGLMACSYNCYLPCLTESFNVGSICGFTALAGVIGSGYFLLDENQVVESISHTTLGGGGLLVGLFSLMICLMCCCGAYPPAPSPARSSVTFSSV